MNGFKTYTELRDFLDSYTNDLGEIQGDPATIAAEAVAAGYVAAEGFHGELRLIIEQAEGTPLALLVPQAQALLALPEESVAALVAAAQSMVGAASFGR